MNENHGLKIGTMVLIGVPRKKNNMTISGRKVEERFFAALERIQTDQSREAAYEFMLASAQAFRQGVGISGIELDRCFDKVYGKKP